MSSFHEEAVRSSRVEPTRLPAGLAAKVDVGVFVSVSAVGVHGADRADEELTKDSQVGQGFLADLVADAAHGGDSAGGRVVMIRTGIVQSA